MADVPWAFARASRLLAAIILTSGAYFAFGQLIQPQDVGIGTGQLGGLGGVGGIGGGFGGNYPGGGGFQQGIGPPDAPPVFTGTGNSLYYGGMFIASSPAHSFPSLVNLVPFGPEVGDHAVHPGLLTAGQTIDLHMYFPFYGGYYNYTTVCLRTTQPKGL